MALVLIYRRFSFVKMRTSSCSSFFLSFCHAQSINNDKLTYEINRLGHILEYYFIYSSKRRFACSVLCTMWMYVSMSIESINSDVSSRKHLLWFMWIRIVFVWKNSKIRIRTLWWKRRTSYGHGHHVFRSMSAWIRSNECFKWENGWEWSEENMWLWERNKCKQMINEKCETFCTFLMHRFRSNLCCCGCWCC